MDIYHMTDVIPLIGVPLPPAGRVSYNIPCPCCDDSPRKKHLNINLKKDVFRCPRCGFSGGVFDLYAHYAKIPRGAVRNALAARLDVCRNASKSKQPQFSEEPECPPTDIDARHATYSALLGKLSLASDHMDNLLSRGLPPEAIRNLGYRTTPVIGMASVAKQLQDEGLYLAGVPGFYRNRENEQWTFIQPQRGILIPVRDMHGRIQGLQIRRDNVARRKFRWVSSAEDRNGKPLLDGCRAMGWVHVAGPPQSVILLIEGPLKADIVHCLTGHTVVAVAGVNTLSLLEETLQVLREHEVKRIMTAFDMDFLSNPHVQSGYNNLTQLLTNLGFSYGTYVWDPQYNGLDDYVWKHCLQRELSK